MGQLFLRNVIGGIALYFQLVESCGDTKVKA